ncbi:MAG: serine hydrolase [Bacteroidetes bacterium]|nr:serine hydrolase [Bacteroidota bacterium]
MICKRIAIPFYFFLLFFNLQAWAQNASSFPHSLPEVEGVTSSNILQYLSAVEKSKNEPHSIMILRHGKVVAEGWWNPYQSNLRHTMYSTSKSFTSTAIGFAVSEKRLTVNDKVISFFPNDLPDSVSPYLASLTVRDVLSMSDGMEPDPTFAVASKDSNWVKAFLALPIKYKPGSQFLYNSLGTFILSAIIQKTTGQKTIDYLRPRLFEPLGIEDMDWEENLQGINTGGWGLRIKTEDMAKLGQLYLQKGKWKGKQLLPASWIEEATSTKIIQHPQLSQAKKDSSDWEQGYCYQFWRCRHHCYRADGAFGQYIIVMPDQDAVIAITSETPDMQDELNLVWKYLLPAFQKGKLPVNKKMEQALQQKLASLKLPLLAKKDPSPIEKNISGKLFSFMPNEKHIESISFLFDNNDCHIVLKTDTATYPLSFGPGSWKLGETNMRPVSIVSGARENFSILSDNKIAGSYEWLDNQTIELLLRFIESPHTEKIICHFDGKNIHIETQNSFDFGSKKAMLTGSTKG